MKKRGTCICAGGCLTTSLVFLVAAVTVLVLIQVGFFKETLDKYIQGQTTLEPGHETYKQWVDPTIPMYKDFYIFNLTNPTEFARGAKPRFDELGPYRYREVRQKTVLNEADGTITYLMNRSFHFEHSTENNYTENDVITTINFAFVTAVYNAHSMVEKIGLQGLIELSVRPKPELLIKTTVHNLLWDYTDPLLHRLNQIGKVDTSHISLQLNNSYSDRELPSVVHSGTVDSKKTAQFIEWAGLKQLPFWKNEANFINTSTSGIIWHSIIERDEKLEAFISDVNRTFHIHYHEDVSVRGIDAYRFQVEERDFHPDPNYHTDNSTPVGLIFLGVLQKPEAPVFGSKPHFLDCDPSLYNATEGISPPDRNKHDIVVDIEPITGATINVHLQLQINFNVTKTSLFFPSFHHITPVIFPVFYLDEHATIDDGLKAKLNKMVFVPLTAVNSSIWVIFGLCCFISLLTGLCTLRWCIKLYQLRDRRPETIPLLAKTDT